MPLLTKITESLATLDNATNIDQRRKVQSKVAAAAATMGDMLIEQAGELAVAHAEARQLRDALAGQDQVIQQLQAERDDLQRQLDLARHPLEPAPVIPAMRSRVAPHDIEIQTFKHKQTYSTSPVPDINAPAAVATAGEVIYDAGEKPQADDVPQWQKLGKRMRQDLIKLVAKLCASDPVGVLPEQIQQRCANVKGMLEALLAGDLSLVMDALVEGQHQGLVEPRGDGPWIAVVK